MSGSEQQAFTFGGGQRPSAVAEGGRPLRRNKVLEAGAGTGKTTAIVAEVLHLLLSPDEVAPERIILVTFTEKAAGEIADRIEKALNEIHGEVERGAVHWPLKSARPLLEVSTAQRPAVERQLARIDGLRSQTIHSFCQTLLRQYPIEAGVDPQFQIVEGFDRSLLYGQLYDEWIDRETRTGSHPTAALEWEAVLEHYGYLFLAQKAIFALVDRRHLLLDESYDIGSVIEYEPFLFDALDTIRASGRHDSRITKYCRESDLPKPGSSIDSWIEYLAPIAADLRQADLRDEKDCREAIRTLRVGDKGTSAYDLLISHRAAAAVLSLTRRFIARLDEEKRKRGLLDFDDLLIRTRVLLDHPAALDRIRQQFDFIFIDEFQDTDRIQAEIFDRLARDKSGNYVPGKTTVVGDPKQSIYGFRRADPETYRRFTDNLAESGSRELLVNQFRSTPELLKTFNAIGPALFTEDQPDPNVFQPAYHELTPAKTSDAACDASFTFIGCQSENGDDRAEAEAEAIAAWIQARDHSDLRRFALLFRRKRRIDAYLDVFDRRGLKYVVPPMGLFLDRPAAVDLLTVLRSIAYRYDVGAHVSAARTPYFALTDREITAGILGSDSPAWKAAMESLESFRDAARHLTVTGLIDHVIRTSGIESVLQATREGARSLRHLEQVRAIAFIYDQKAGGSVRQFVEEIARRREVPEEVEPSILDDTTNAVRILTIHGAKGLEFDTVIIPDVEFSGGRDGADFFTVDEPRRTLVLRNGLDTLSGVCRFSEGRPLKDIAGLRDKAELRRLFYVAVTRARTEVAIVCNSGSKPTRSGFGLFLKEIFDADEWQWPPAGERVVRSLRGIPLAYEKVEPMQTTDRVAGRLCDEELEKKLISGPLIPCVVPQPESIPVLSGVDLKIARKASPNRVAGILLHRILERWDGASDVAPLLASLAMEQAADERSIDLVRRRLATVAQSPMLRRIAAAETVGREMPVAFVDGSGTIVQKRIDRLIRERDSDAVIDYKSGEPSESRLEGDRDQVALYCRLVAQMTSRPCRGVLWYIDAENDVVVDV